VRYRLNLTGQMSVNTPGTVDWNLVAEIIVDVFSILNAIGVFLVVLMRKPLVPELIGYPVVVYLVSNQLATVVMLGRFFFDQGLAHKLPPEFPLRYLGLTILVAFCTLVLGTGLAYQRAWKK
jgi:hypothetical protein